MATIKNQLRHPLTLTGGYVMSPQEVLAGADVSAPYELELLAEGSIVIVDINPPPPPPVSRVGEIVTRDRWGVFFDSIASGDEDKILTSHGAGVKPSWEDVDSVLDPAVASRLLPPGADLSGALLGETIDAASGQRLSLDDKADLVAGKVPSSQIPAIATGEIVTVGSQAAMLALSTGQVQPGDVAIRIDLSGQRFVLADPDPSVLGHWIALETPDAVSSVNGQAGAVLLAAADVGAPTTAQLTALDAAKINVAEKAAVNGVATLDAISKVPVGQLPAIPSEGISDIALYGGPGGANLTDARTFGITADARRFNDATLTGTALTSPEQAVFTAADVGKTVLIPLAGSTGAGTGQALPLKTTVAAYVSATQVTLATPALWDVAGVFCVIGTDDTVAWQFALDSMAALGGGGIWFPNGYSLLTSTVFLRSLVSIYGGGMHACGFISHGQGTSYIFATASPAANPSTKITKGVVLADFEVDGSPMSYTRPGWAGSAGFTVNQKAISLQFGESCHLSRLKIHDTLATGIALDYNRGSSITDCLIYNTGKGAKNGQVLPGLGSGGGGAGIGIGTGVWEVEDFLVQGNRLYNCGNYGIFFEAEDTSYSSRGIRILDNYIEGGCNVAGIGDHGVKGVQVANNQVYNVIGVGINAVDHLVGRASDGNIHDNRIDGAYDGIRVTVGAGGVGPYFLGRNKIRNCSRYGILITQTNIAWEVIKGVELRDNRINACTGGGIAVGVGAAAISGYDGLIIAGGAIYDSGSLAVPAPAILITSTIMSYLRITGVVARDRRPAGQQTQTYGLQVSGEAPLPSAVIVDNDFRGNTLGSIDTAASVVAGSTITRNPG